MAVPNTVVADMLLEGTAAYLDGIERLLRNVPEFSMAGIEHAMSDHPIFHVMVGA